MHPTYSRIIFYPIYYFKGVYSSCWRPLELHTIHDYRPQYILPGPSVTFGYIRLLASLYIISYKHYFYPYDSMLVSSECFISYIHIIRYTQHSPPHHTTVPCRAFSAPLAPLGTVLFTIWYRYCFFGLSWTQFGPFGRNVSKCFSYKPLTQFGLGNSPQSRGGYAISLYTQFIDASHIVPSKQLTTGLRAISPSSCFGSIYSSSAFFILLVFISKCRRLGLFILHQRVGALVWSRRSTVIPPQFRRNREPNSWPLQVLCEFRENMYYTCTNITIIYRHLEYDIEHFSSYFIKYI